MKIKRDLILVVSGRLILAIIGLAVVRIVTVTLSVEQYGELSLLIAVQMFCGLFLVNPLGQHINLHTHEWWDNGTLLPRLSRYKYYILVVATIGALFVMSTSRAPLTSKTMFNCLVVFAMVIGGTWNATLVSMLNMLGFRTESLACAVATVLIGLGSSVMLTKWVNPEKIASAWLMGQAVGMMFGALAARLILQSASASTMSYEKHSLIDRKTFTSYCLPLSIATGFMWLQLSGYRFFVEEYWGLYRLGFMVAGFQLAAQIWGLAETLTSQYLYPYFYKKVSTVKQTQEIQSAYSDLLNISTPVYLILNGMIVACASSFVTLLFDIKFRDAGIYIIIGSFVEMLRVLANLLGNAAHVQRQAFSLAIPYAAGSLVMIGALYIAGVNGLGIEWAWFAISVGSIIVFITMWLEMGKKIKIKIDKWRWIASAFAMTLLFMMSFSLPRNTSSTEAVAILAVLAAVSSLMLYGLIRNSKALSRLTGVELPGDGK